MTEFIACLLIVDDMESIHDLLQKSLSMFEYQGAESDSVEEVLATVAVGRASLKALDLELPNGNGLKLLNLTGQRPYQKQIPVILFAVHEQEKQGPRMPNAQGGEAHIAYPNAIKQETAHVNGSKPATDVQVLRVRELTIDQARRVVLFQNEELHLTPKEYELICLLAAHAGTVLTHERLSYALWGTSSSHTVHLLRVNISNLRRKLDAAPSGPPYIVTEPSLGYRLRADG